MAERRTIMYQKDYRLPDRTGRAILGSGSLMAAMLFAVMVSMMICQPLVVASADNFTDIFYTNSFRGSFSWFKKLDWIGMVVQMVISVFSLVGVSLIVIRIMTSMLYLSAKGLWEEVHDLKETGESERYDFGFGNMLKSWAKGKNGYTGFDAIIGAILTLLPDVKRYSDFGEKSGQKFDEDISIGQYMLKILLPTVIAVFCLAMGFNGTLVKGLAVTVDAMGTVADKAVSVNYAGFIDDLVNSGNGYKFAYSSDGTNMGSLKQSLAKDLYGRAVSYAKGASPAQLQQIGENVATKVDAIASEILAGNGMGQVSSEVIDGVKGNKGDGNSDRYVAFLGYDIVKNTTQTASGEITNISLKELVTGNQTDTMIADDSNSDQYFHIFIKQTSSFSGSYFNIDEMGGEATATGGGTGGAGGSGVPNGTPG